MIGCSCGLDAVFGGAPTGVDHLKSCPKGQAGQIDRMRAAGDELVRILRPLIDRAVDRDVAAAIDDWKKARE